MNQHTARSFVRLIALWLVAQSVITLSPLIGIWASVHDSASVLDDLRSESPLPSLADTLGDESNLSEEMKAQLRELVESSRDSLESASESSTDSLETPWDFTLSYALYSLVGPLLVAFLLWWQSDRLGRLIVGTKNQPSPRRGTTRARRTPEAS